MQRLYKNIIWLFGAIFVLLSGPSMIMANEVTFNIRKSFYNQHGFSWYDAEDKTKQEFLKEYYQEIKRAKKIKAKKEKNEQKQYQKRQQRKKDYERKKKKIAKAKQKRKEALKKQKARKRKLHKDKIKKMKKKWAAAKKKNRR